VALALRLVAACSGTGPSAGPTYDRNDADLPPDPPSIKHDGGDAGEAGDASPDGGSGDGGSDAAHDAREDG
jgi:hypothetical protein